MTPTPTREFRDELPALLREWFDWTGHGLSGFAHLLPVACWLLTALALGVLLVLAAAGHGLAAVYRRIAPGADVVPFQARMAGGRR